MLKRWILSLIEKLSRPSVPCPNIGCKGVLTRYEYRDIDQMVIGTTRQCSNCGKVVSHG